MAAIATTEFEYPNEVVVSTIIENARENDDTTRVTSLTTKTAERFRVRQHSRIAGYIPLPQGTPKYKEK